MNNNIAKFKGKIITKPKITHSVMNKNFLEFTLEVKRQSGVSDFIPITMSEKLGNFDVGKFVEINGNVRTFNKYENNKSRLIITVFVNKIELIVDENYSNEILLDGFICKPPIIRETPLGRQISDILLAINNKYGKSYYIPTIVFGRESKWIAEQSVGTKVSISGRLQSRNYEKLLENGEKETRTAIELCVRNIQKVEKGE